MNNTPDVNSYAVYSKISDHRLDFITWTFIGGLGIILCLMWLTETKHMWELYAGGALTGTFILAFIYTRIRRVIAFQHYKKFQEALGFPLFGWNDVVRDPVILKPQNWMPDCTVKVSLKENADDPAKKVINDALYLFVKRANTRFYRASLSGDGRSHWKVTRQDTARGSADCAVTGDIYFLLDEYLKPIQAQLGCIEKVTIEYKGELKYVKFRNGAY